MRGDQRGAEGGQNGTPDPALRRIEVEDPSHGEGRVERVDQRRDASRRDARPGQNPGNLYLGERVLAVTVRGAAMIRSHQHERGFARREPIQHVQDLSNVAVGRLHGAVIFFAIPAVGVPFVIDIVQVDESECGTIRAPIGDGCLGGLGGPVLMPHDVGRLLFQQVRKLPPIVEDGDLAGGIIGAQHSEDRGKLAIRPAADRLEFDHVAQPAVGSDAVLRGRSAVDRRSPVGTTQSRQDAAGFQRPGRTGHQLAKAGHARGGDAVYAQPVHADDDDAGTVPRARRLGEDGWAAAESHNKRQQFCFGAHIIFIDHQLLRYRYDAMKVCLN